VDILGGGGWNYLSFIYLCMNIRVTHSIVWYDCNTLQHTATHCNTLQHTILHAHTCRDAYMYISMHIYMYACIYTWRIQSCDVGWLRWVASIKLQVSFAEYRLFYRDLLQKRPIILSILVSEASPQDWQAFDSYAWNAMLLLSLSVSLSLPPSLTHTHTSWVIPRIWNMAFDPYAWNAILLLSLSLSHTHTHTHTSWEEWFHGYTYGIRFICVKCHINIRGITPLNLCVCAWESERERERERE